MRVIGTAFGVAIFLLVIVGGGIYRSECVTGTGQNHASWAIGESFPYTTNSKSGCESHTLTRYVLGKIGVGSDVERNTYRADLIREIGVGSDELAQLRRSVSSAAVFSVNHKLETTLTSGELSKLSPNDLDALAASSRRVTRNLSGDLARIDRLSSQLARAKVSTDADPSPSAQRFITVWDGLLAASRVVLEQDRLGVATSGPVMDELGKVIAAARTAQASGSTAQFHRALGRWRLTTEAVERRLERKEAAVRKATQPLVKAFEAYIRRDKGAESIVTQVNQQFPKGLLAQENKEP